MDHEEFKEIVVRKARADGIVISRVPKPTRDKFVELANSDFAGDYGLLLKYLWDHYELWLWFMNNWDTKLDYIIQSLSNKIEKKPDSNIKLLDGRKVEKEVKEE